MAVFLCFSESFPPLPTFYGSSQMTSLPPPPLSRGPPPLTAARNPISSLDNYQSKMHYSNLLLIECFFSIEGHEAPDRNLGFQISCECLTDHGNGVCYLTLQSTYNGSAVD